ncbi:MAG: thioredoxin family protein [Rhodospirillales bacterium]|nr:thioredoxin family protein [Rhodospirillales bacterium]
MSEKRKVEVFSAGCSVCDDAVAKVKELACGSCEVSVLDMMDQKVADYAKRLGIDSVPAVAINGALASCCQGRGIDEAALRAAGIGSPL